MTDPFHTGGAGLLVLKLGGELIETADARAHIVSAVATLARSRPLLVVHGGGRAIDAELQRRGVTPKKVDGLRVTDSPTMDAVVAVLAGTANTELVAALVTAGVRAVGLTGVDAACGRAARALPIESTSGELVDLGLVGDPADVDPTLFELLMTSGYVPVVASIGIDPASAALLNVNADVMACRIASALGATELVIAGATAGVLDTGGRTIAELDCAEAETLIHAGTANAGMIAKLRASIGALEDGVVTVRIVDGRARDASSIDDAPGTLLTLSNHHAVHAR